MLLAEIFLLEFLLGLMHTVLSILPIILPLYVSDSRLEHSAMKIYWNISIKLYVTLVGFDPSFGDSSPTLVFSGEII